MSQINMTNKDIVLHSPDPYLLMRMFTELQMDGRFDDDLGWNESKTSLVRASSCYLAIYNNKSIDFHNHNCFPAKLIPLTEQNYLATLKMILE